MRCNLHRKVEAKERKEKQRISVLPEREYRLLRIIRSMSLWQRDFEKHSLEVVLRQKNGEKVWNLWKISPNIILMQYRWCLDAGFRWISSQRAPCFRQRRCKRPSNHYRDDGKCRWEDRNRREGSVGWMSIWQKPIDPKLCMRHYRNLFSFHKSYKKTSDWHTTEKECERGILCH